MKQRTVSLKTLVDSAETAVLKRDASTALWRAGSITSASAPCAQMTTGGPSSDITGTAQLGTVSGSWGNCTASSTRCVMYCFLPGAPAPYTVS